MQELTDLSSASSTPSRYASAESGYSSPYEPDHPVPAPATSDETRILAEDVRIQARPLQLATSALHMQDLSADSKGTLREERAGKRGFKCEDANYHQLYRSRSADNTPIGFAGVSWREQSASAPGSFETRPNEFSREREDKGSRQDGAPSGALVDDSHMKGAQSPSRLVFSSGIDLGASDAASQGGIESGQAIARRPTIEDGSQSLEIAYEAWKVSEQAKAHLHDSKKKLGRFLELAFR